jgi:hypothetical protein
MLGVVMVLAIPLFASAQTANHVYFYQDINYKGAVISFNGIRDVPDLRAYPMNGSQNWNDRISSIKVGTGVKLIVYKDINYKGGSYELTGPAWISTLVSNGWNDKISSFRVVPE